MEHPDAAPLADDGERSAIPDDQPLGGPAGPEDEHMPPRTLAPGPGEQGPRDPSPETERGRG